MSKLQELIQEYCPDGVEYKKLEDCCAILDNKRKPVTKAMRKAGRYPYYGANGVQDYVDSYIFDGTFVLVGEDGSVVTSDGHPVVTWATGKIWVNNHAHIIEEVNGVLLRYIFHALQSIKVNDLIHGNIPKLTGRDFKNLEIPVPPLPVQQEIVRILDSYTETEQKLEEKLKQELEQRKKQYGYYRHFALNPAGVSLEKPVCNDFKDISEQWRKKRYAITTLKAVTKLFRGDYITKKSTTPGDIPVILGGQEPAYYIDHSNHTGPIVTVARSGASAGFVAYWNRPIYLTDGFGFEADNDIVNIKYLYYTLKDKENSLNDMKRGAGVPHISGERLGETLMYLPTLEKQEEVVRVLDNFNSICTDLTSGLPAEIALRKKQYEYYRDRLLSFPRKA